MTPTVAALLRRSRRQASDQRPRGLRLSAAASTDGSPDARGSVPAPAPSAIVIPVAPWSWTSSSTSFALARLPISYLRRLDSRIDQPIGNVDQHVSDNDEECVEQGYCPDNRVVSSIDTGDVEVSHAGDVEDFLDDDRPGHQGGDRRSHDRHDRYQGVADDVAEHDDSVAQPLRPGRAHILVVQLLQHGGAR